jgi:phage gpG-like protein
MTTKLSQKWASLGNFGGEIIIDFVPDPDEIANAFLRVADELENTAVPLLAAKAVAIADMKAHFDTEFGPDGHHWTPLDNEYQAWKEEHGHPRDILRLSGALEDTATSDQAWEVVGDTLEFNTGILPSAADGTPYWFFHQVGTDDGERAGQVQEYKKSIRLSREAGLGVAETGGSHESFGIGRGKALPARPFIGLDEDAQLSVIEIFDKWFDESITTFQRSGGLIQTKTPSGQFGPIVR